MAVLAAAIALAVAAYPPAGSTSILSGGGRGPAGGGYERIVWVAVEGERKVAKVHVGKRRVLRRFRVNGRPHNITVSPSGDAVATALWNNARIAIVRNGSVRHTYLGGAPHDVKIDHGRVVVANQGDERVDLVSTRGKRRGSINLIADPHDLTLKRSDDVAWVTLEGTGKMAIVNVEKKRVVRYKRTGKAPHDLLFAPDGRLWVTDWHGAVHVFSRRGRRVKTIRLGVEAHHLDFTPDGKQVWITDHGAHRVFVLNTGTYRVRKRFPIKGAPHHVTITSDGKRAVVADHDRGVLVVYNTVELNRMFKIRVGAGPHGVWAAP
jgi:YVTN family beta-propeller protein